MGQEQSQVAQRSQERQTAERSSRELHRDVQQTRSEMDETIDELVARLNPGELVSRAVNSLFQGGGSRVGRKGQQAGRAARDLGANLVERVRENPVPVALMVAGAAWFFLSGDDSDQAEYDLEAETGGGLRDRAGRAAGAAAAGAKSARDRVMGGATSTATAVRSGARGAARSLRSGGRSAARGARLGMQMSREGYDAAMADYPLAVGAAALGLGLLCGLAVPETRREHELLGPARDDLLETGQQTVKETLEHGKEVAGKATAAAQDTLKEEGLGPRDLKEKMERTAKETAETVKHESKRSANEPGS